MTPADLRATMDRMGLTTAQMARAARVNERTVRRWLSGDRRIPAILEALVVAWGAATKANVRELPI